MAKQGEIDYLRNLGEDGIRHAVYKPFSDPDCGRYLIEIGTVMSLLPPPPARLLDLGCGTGWTSVFFAKRGYRVVGVDIAADMIFHARQNRDREELDELEFLTSDYEDLEFDNEFDAAVFYDSLHHAVDEEVAIRQVFRALRPGGVCVTSEPGVGHHASPGAIQAMKRFNVNEKDMPPERIVQLGREAGFRSFRIYPHGYVLNHLLYRWEDSPTPPRRTNPIRKVLGQVRRRLGLAPHRFAYVLDHLDQVHTNGIVRMVK